MTVVDTSIRNLANGFRLRLPVVDLECPVSDDLSGSVMLLGNFDGLHQGHKSLVDAGRELAGRLRAPLSIMSCEPHPRQFLRPSNGPFRLATNAGKRLAFTQLGFDFLFEPRFDELFACISPLDFASQILCRHLRVKAVVVGRDFRFGHRRAGGVEELAAFGREFGFEVLVAPDLNIENERLSSSRIREWISCGNLRKVSEGFAGQWITSASVDEEGLIRFEAFQCLPPSGTYQVEILQVTGALRSREILELHQGRTAQLTIRAGATFGEVLIAGWSPIDLY